jgi:hypothetical protein
MLKRRHFKQQTTLEDRLAAWAAKVREQAETMKPGPQKKALLQKASQAETALQVNDWINSPGLAPPLQAIAAGRAISEARRRAAKERTKSRA